MAIDMTGEMQLIDTALADGFCCLLGTADASGAPQISPKGSIMVYDAGRLAFWERAGRSAAANLRENDRVVIYYRNTDHPARPTWRFYGRARIVGDGPDFDAVYERTVTSERDKDPDRKGVAVLIEVSRINDLSGRIIQEA